MLWLCEVNLQKDSGMGIQHDRFDIKKPPTTEDEQKKM